MKKIILSATAIVALAFAAQAANQNIQNEVSIEISADEKVKVEVDKLPDAVKTTLQSEEYKGWAATEAYWVSKVEGLSDHYEITLKNEAQQVSVVLLDKEGKKVEKK